MRINQIFIFFCFLFLFSIFYSKFLLSVSIISMFILAVYQASQIGFKNSLSDYFKHPHLFVISLYFVAILISGINSSNVAEWLHQVKMKLPYLTIPFMLYAFREQIHKHYHLFHQFFIGLAIFSSLPILFYIFSNSEIVKDLLSKGQSVETPVDHIKYSLFVSFACISSFVLAFKKDLVRSSLIIHRYVYFAVSFYLFIFLHFLAVRSGLVLAYFVGFIAVLNQVRLLKRPILLLPLFAFFGLIPICTYHTVPSIKAKVGYMLYDLDKYRKGEGSNYSDSERIHTIKAGIELFKKHPIMGTGIGDLLESCNALVAQKLNKEIHKYPHNQFIFVLSGMGLLGFVLFVISFFYPWALFPYQNWLFIYLALLICSSFLVENTLERSYSIAFFCFFYGSGIVFSRREGKF